MSDKNMPFDPMGILGGKYENKEKRENAVMSDFQAYCEENVHVAGGCESAPEDAVELAGKIRKALSENPVIMVGSTPTDKDGHFHELVAKAALEGVPIPYIPVHMLWPDGREKTLEKPECAVENPLPVLINMCKRILPDPIEVQGLIPKQSKDEKDA